MLIAQSLHNVLGYWKYLWCPDFCFDILLGHVLVYRWKQQIQQRTWHRINLFKTCNMCMKMFPVKYFLVLTSKICLMLKAKMIFFFFTFYFQLCKCALPCLKCTKLYRVFIFTVQSAGLSFLNDIHGWFHTRFFFFCEKLKWVNNFTL